MEVEAMNAKLRSRASTVGPATAPQWLLIRRQTGRTILMLAPAIFTACVTAGVPAQRTDIQKSQVYSATIDQVWEAIIASVAEANFPITTLEKSSGIVAIANQPYSLGLANEGKRGSACGQTDAVVERLCTFNIVATVVSADKTKVQVNMAMRMRIRSGNGSQMCPFNDWWADSYSNGRLETGILSGIQTRLRPTSPSPS